uniref:Uncharacterized protein n=1 Tax=Chromera velia CCMP2878 TaxID=1169474 RepID=A0A0G4IFW4_9ALVE|eukprot:Cvel_14043.t1-p1 / transcript=Cvel_14043.t1 / gene=Cvel_14043 / organism=Chromera_velia_CCMP2878 / gene_product=hypothetical protein / transcript_product=hypothetical protein / location=Cvel_scaffold984:28668-37522(-) / protein_length=820 / sequence_SO=supercontig / SO=protein_coding / is_pseudo=false
MHNLCRTHGRISTDMSRSSDPGLPQQASKLALAFQAAARSPPPHKRRQQDRPRANETSSRAPRLVSGDPEVPVLSDEAEREGGGERDALLQRVEEGRFRQSIAGPDDDLVHALAEEFQGEDDDESSVAASDPDDLSVALPSDEELMAMLERRSVSVRQSQMQNSSQNAASSRVAFDLPGRESRKSIRQLVVAETNQRLQFRRFEGPDHVRPDENTKYFIDNPIQYPPGHVPLGVLFPFYNEEAEELQASLQSLAAEVEAMGDLEELDATFQVCLVMDGWKAASESMRKWLKEEVFPVSLQENQAIPWWVHIEECDSSKATFSVCRVMSPAEAQRRETVSAQGRMSIWGGGGRGKAKYAHLGEGLSQGAVPTPVSCFMGFYSLLGALPVIPGPCGIYRIKDLVKSGTLKLYFDTVNAHTMQVGGAGGGEGGGGEGNRARTSIQFFQMLATVISPALFAWLLYVAALEVLQLNELGLAGDVAEYLSMSIAGFYVVLSLTSLLTAMCVKWSPVLFFTFLGFGALSMITFIGVAFRNGWDPAVSAVDSVAWVAFLLPFAVLLTSSLESFCRTLTRLVPYILCLPLTINYFAVYAFARTSDLSWGNRPAAKEGEEDESAREAAKLKAQYNRIGICIAMGVILLNIGVCAALYIDVVVRYSIFLFAGFTAVIPLVGTFVFNLWRLFIHVKRCCCGAQSLSRKIMRNRHERLALAVQKNAMDKRKDHREIVEMIERLNERLDELTIQQPAQGQGQSRTQSALQVPWSPPRSSHRGSIESGMGEGGGLKRQGTYTITSPSGNRRMTAMAGPQGLPDNKQQGGGGCLMS